MLCNVTLRMPHHSLCIHAMILFCMRKIIWILMQGKTAMDRQQDHNMHNIIIQQEFAANAHEGIALHARDMRSKSFKSLLYIGGRIIKCMHGSFCSACTTRFL